MEPKKSSIVEKLDLAAEKYSSNELLRATVVGIPWIGGSLDAVFGARGSELVVRRIEALVSQLQERFQDVEKRAVREDFIQSDEFVHPVQVYLDLSAHPERADEAAKQLRANHLRWSTHA